MNNEAVNGESSFGQWLQSTLNERRLSVQDFSQRARISRGGIYHYLKDKRVPDQTAMASIAAALGLPLSAMPSVTPKKVGRPPRKVS